VWPAAGWQEAESAPQCEQATACDAGHRAETEVEILGTQNSLKRSRAFARAAWLMRVQGTGHSGTDDGAGQDAPWNGGGFGHL
jgi:hypothetical protein